MHIGNVMCKCVCKSEMILHEERKSQFGLTFLLPKSNMNLKTFAAYRKKVKG